MIFLIYFFIFIFGSAIGSFLNVIICRLETGEDIVKKRSHCVRCGRVLRWFELIPIISFFILRGRCRNCREKISWQYPLAEAATGLLFILTVAKLFPELVEGSIIVLDSASLRSNNIFSLFYWLYISCSLVVIFVYDLRHYIIPDKMLWPAIAAAGAYRLFLAFGFSVLWRIRSGNNLTPELVEGFKLFYPYLLSGLAAAAFFLFLVLITRGRGMGMGDAKLAFLMGLLLGWPGILAALFLAFFAGAAVGLALIAFDRKTLKSPIPFGPFLICGTLAVLFWGQSLSAWICSLALCG